MKHLSFIFTFLFLCAGSDLQSRSMCSPTLMSGISPLLTGMGMLHKGQTGTWTSCNKHQRHKDYRSSKGENYHHHLCCQLWYNHIKKYNIKTEMHYISIKGALCNIFTGCKQTKKGVLDARNSSLQELTWLLDVL